jgi:hypothetical protein
VDLWIVVMGDESTGQSVLGAYSTEKLAEATAERASPGDWYTIPTVVDEVPDWIDENEHELQREADEEFERLQNPARS